MFDADKGNQKVADQVDSLSDDFAARFTALPPRQQQTLLTKFNEMLDNPDSVTAFANGTYAQDSSGQPAKALGSGSAPSSEQEVLDAREAIKVILADTTVDASFKHLLRRGYDQSAPDHIEVEADGTPKALRSSQQETKTQKDRADNAEKELKDERDESKSGSLAEQLKKAKAAAATPADMVEKSKIVAGLKKLRDMVDDISSMTKVRGKAEALQAIDEEIDKAS